MKLRELYKPGDKLYIVFGVIWWIIFLVSIPYITFCETASGVDIAITFFVIFIPFYTSYYTIAILGVDILRSIDILAVIVIIYSCALAMGSCIFVSVFLGRFYNVFSKFLKEKGWRGIAKSKELKIVAIISILTFFIAYTLSYLIDHIPLSEGLYFGVYIIIYELLMFLFGVGVGFVRKKNSLYVCFVGRLIPVIIFLFYDLIHGESYEIISCFMPAYFGVISSFFCGYGGILGAKLRR